MSVRWIMTLLMGLTLSAAILASPAANAQVFSSKGVKQEAEKAGINRCADGALRSQERLLTLRNRINTILNCNRQGQVYDRNAGVCITPHLSPDHIYKNRANGDTLAFINPDGTNGADAVLGGKNGNSVTCITDPVACALPWGGSIAHGASVTAYRVASVSYGDSCDASGNVETRTCNNGNLSGSFTNESCGTGTPNNCTAPWGETVAHGSSVTAYETEVAPDSGECNSQERVCTNGSLSGSFRYQTCEPDTPDDPQPPTKDCFFWVSGYTPPYGVIGSDDDGSNHVGAGAYPDATKPFAKANAKTFDMIAIGPKTRLIIYKEPNFKGGTFIDIHGPKVIGNKCLAPESSFPRDWKTNPTTRLANSSPDMNGTKYLSVKSTIYSSMFPPNTRVEYNMNKTSAGCGGTANNIGNYTRDQLMWGGGSVKVICDRN